MTKTMKLRRHRFLFGGAIAALVTSFAFPVVAQPVSSASGTRVVATDQSQTNTAVTASGIDPFVDLTGDLTSSSVTVANNVASAAAQANKASATLSPTALDLAPSFTGTSITTGPDGTNANASALIATRQNTDQTTVTGNLGGSITGTRLGTSLGDVSASSVKVTGNTEEAIALANDASSTASLTGGAVAGGVGLVNDQSVTGNAAVTADQNGTIRLRANSASGSDLTLSGNLERAIAYGSSAANALTIDATSITAPPSVDLPSTVQAFSVTPSVAAAFAVVSDQRLEGSVKAIDSGWFNERVFGPVDGSSLTSASNSLVAAGYGNQVANTLTLAAPSIASGGDVGGGVANVTNVQQVGAGSVSASAAFGSRLLVDGPLSNSTAALKDNAVVALATGNQADSNQLTVTGGAITAGAGNGGGVIPPVQDVVGTALADPSGVMTVTAPFSVQNDQRNQGAISATITPAGMPISVAGAVSNASIAASGNSASGTATGNSATNGLTLQGTQLATAADLNSLQLGQGIVSTQIGTTDVPAGVQINLGIGVSGSALSVTGNSVTGSATQNSVNNTLGVTAVSLFNASDHSNAEAGATDGGLGAAADYALASQQQIRGGYQLPVAVNSDVEGTFGVTAGGNVTGSSVAVSDNSQSSAALGNGAANTLTLTAANVGGLSGGATGSALSSIQSGATDVQAVSDMALATPAIGDGSSLTVSGNTNTATARMNSATNTLSVSAASLTPLSGSTTVQGSLGSVGEVTGDNVLASTQDAQGSVDAKAVTTFAAFAAGPFTRVSTTISGNQTQALATANTATNSLSLTSVTGDGAGAGLGNVQLSFADVTANASTALANGGGSILNGERTLTGNVTAAQAVGNSASNAMTLASGASVVPGMVTATTGPLNAASVAILLTNSQMNAGGVTAISSAPNAAVGQTGTINASSAGLTGNTVTAAAYGNNATNTVTLASSGWSPAAAIVNTQVNTAPVTAQVVSASYAVSPVATSGSRLALTGNAVTAQAIGNYAASAITASH